MPGDLILHHHDPSPFAEKIRAAFGIKRLAWRSVQVPMIMPKPDLVALTGGYRGTPVLQVGADMYCDTRLIIAELERRHPEPPLLGAGPLVEFGLQHWSDEAVFPLGAALAMHGGAAVLPRELLEERRAYFSDLDFARFGEDAAHFEVQLCAHLAIIERQLADGRAFLLGQAQSWTDLNAYYLVWMLGGHVPGSAAMVTEKPRLTAWRDRLTAFGNGTREDITAAEAIAIAAAAELPEADGPEVSVFPVAHPETAATGRLVLRSDEEIVIRRRDPRAGEVAVHFPVIGYRVEPQS